MPTPPVSRLLLANSQPEPARGGESVDVGRYNTVDLAVFHPPTPPLHLRLLS